MPKDKFDNYRKETKNDKTRLNREEFRAALSAFNKKVIDEIIFNNFEFSILNMGVLSLRKTKVEKFKDGKVNKRLGIDWVKTKEYKKVIYLVNEHTDGYKYFFNFKPFNYKNKKYYTFKASRNNNRYLAKILKNPDIYGKIDAYIK